jgi:hypothetical protein
LHDVNAGRFADGGAVGRPSRLSRRAASVSAQDAPLVGSMTFVVDERKGAVRDQMGDAVFTLRRIQRGGVHA